MSYYGRDRSPHVIRERVGADSQSRRPVTRKVGHNARVTVETGATDRRTLEDREYDARRRLERERIGDEKLQRRRQELLGRPVVYYEPISRLQRPSSLPDHTNYDSPVLRASAPPSEPRLGAEVAEEVFVPADGGDAFVEYLDFKIPKADNRVLFSDDVTFIIPDSGLNGSKDKPSEPSKPKFTGEMTEMVIAQSQWDGNTFERGELGAEIGTIHSGPEKQLVPLMRWYHLHRPMMNFEEFMAAAQSVLQLPEKEQRDVVKLLRDVQKKFEKQRNHGRELDANCVSDVFYNDTTGSSRQTESVIFL